MINTRHMSSQLFIGIFLTSQILLCQSQGPGGGFEERPPSGFLSLDKEIAKFESQIANGGDGFHATDARNAHAHVHDSSAPDVTSGVTGRHSHRVNHVEVPDKKISDIHGNQPPHPGGLHVDLPFEHGNDKPFPVLHTGSEPIKSSGPGHGGHDVHGDPSVGLPAQLGPPTFDDVLGPSGGMALADGIQSGPPVMEHKHLGPSHPQPTNFVSTLDGPGLVIPDGIASGPPDLHNIAHGGGMHSGVHVDPPNTHGNNLPVPVVHRPSGNGGTHLGTHVDLPGVHNNNLDVPVIHRPGTGGPFSPVHTGVHVDAPGIHGNDLPVPVVHRPGEGHPPMQPGHGDGVHVDQPGMHGNNMPVPVIHRPGGGPSMQIGHDGTHVDHPGMHGNNMPVPVIHRPGGSHPVPHGGLGSPVANVDQLGMHGNDLAVPVVHRPGIGQPHPHAHDGAHVDQPGMHGNNLPVPIVHRPSGKGHSMPDVHPAAGIGPPISTGPVGVNIDHTGVHGNNLPVPMIHRPSGIGSPMHPGDSVHVDHPGMHGNNLPVPVVHRPHGIIKGATPFGPGPDIHGKPPGIHGKGHNGGIHIDMPGEHGNPHNEPAVHLPDGATIHDAVAAGVIPPSDPRPIPDIHDFGMMMPKPVMNIGVPKGAGNVAIAPTRNEERRMLRRLQRKEQRIAQRKAQRKAQRNGIIPPGGLLDDVIAKSKAINDHAHPEPKKPKQGVVVIRRSRPPVTGILSTILGSLMSPRPIGPRPMTVKLGPPLPPPPPQGDPLQTVANTMLGMLMNGLVTG